MANPSQAGPTGGNPERPRGGTLGRQAGRRDRLWTALDSTVGEDKPLRRRGAMMADTVGAGQD